MFNERVKDLICLFIFTCFYRLTLTQEVINMLYLTFWDFWPYSETSGDGE